MDDIGHRETEKLIAQMDKKVAYVYQQAAKETQKKLDDYLKAFERKDKKKRELLDAGEITQKEYSEWRTGQIMIGKRWEEMRDTLAQDYHNSNEIARSIVNGYMPEVYALNHNYGTFQVEKESLVDTSYTLYDRQTVERLMRDDPELLPAPGEQMNETFKKFDAYKKGESVDLSKKEKRAFDKLIAENKDIRWQKGQIQSVMTQSILQGESVPHMAQRVARTIGETNRKATTRYVRTAATGAQNAGRVDSYKRAQDMGIELEQEWLATLDNRTRHEHRELDGQHVPVGKPFEVDGEEIRFPGDPTAPGYLIWNCRCTLVPRLKNLDQSNAPRNSKVDNMTYEEWRGEHKQQSNKNTTNKNRVVTNEDRRIYGKNTGQYYDVSDSDKVALYETKRQKNADGTWGAWNVEKTGEFNAPKNDNVNEVIAFGLPDGRKTRLSQDATKNTIMTQGRVALRDYSMQNDSRSNVADIVQNEMYALTGVRQNGVFYRVIGSNSEIDYIKNGTIRASVNHMTGKQEDGLSVWEIPKYGGGQIVKVTGDVIGIGSDGEPLLDISTVKFVDVFSDEAKKRDLAIKTFANRYKWTEAQVKKALSQNIIKK